MKRAPQEAYLKKAARPILLRPFTLFTVTLTLLLYALDFLFRWQSGLAELFCLRVELPLAGLLARGVALIPFSLTETCFFAGLILLIVLAFRAFLRLLRLPGRRLRRFLRGVVSLATAVLLGLNLYLFFYQLPQKRPPLTAKLKLSPADLSPRPEELASSAKVLIGEMNDLRKDLPEDREGVFRTEKGPYSCFVKSSQAFSQLGSWEPLFSPAVQARPKPLTLSPLLSRMGLAGFYSPFFVEPQVNTQQPKALWASTALHELAHANGYTREDEAEALAFLLGRQHSDAEVRYSSRLGALQRLLPVLKQSDEALWQESMSALSPACRRDMAAISTFWQSRQGKLAEKVRDVNDRFLKSQGQSGVAAYSESVRLLHFFIRNKDLPQQPAGGDDKARPKRPVETSPSQTGESNPPQTGESSPTQTGESSEISPAKTSESRSR